MLAQIVLIHDPRETLMPTVMNDMRTGEMAGVRLRGLLAAVALSVVVGYFVSATSFVATCYRYGAATMDKWGAIDAPHVFFDRSIGYLDNPRPLNVVALRNVLIAMVIAASMIAMRSRFLWFTLHPMGLITGSSWEMSIIWFSIFIAWVLKAAVMRWGGLEMFRRLLPFFLGLVLGDALMGGLWALVGIATGVSTPMFMPP
jgi:hypothetical protein